MVTLLSKLEHVTSSTAHAFYTSRGGVATVLEIAEAYPLPTLLKEG